MRVIIAGGRTFDDMPTLLRAIAESGFPISEVVSGACGIDADVHSRDARVAVGADGLGETWARLNGVPVRRFYAAFRALGRSAGPIRNAEMAEYGQALIALPGDRGTTSMIREARKRGRPVFAVTSGAPAPMLGRRPARDALAMSPVAAPSLFQSTSSRGRE